MKAGLVGRSVPPSGGGKVPPLVTLAGILQALINAIPGAFWPDTVRAKQDPPDSQDTTRLVESSQFSRCGAHHTGKLNFTPAVSR